MTWVKEKGISEVDTNVITKSEQHGERYNELKEMIQQQNDMLQQMGADLQAKKINYNNSPILKWCLTNTGVETDRNGNIVPVKNQADKMRIDGTASMLDAYVGLFEHHDEFLGAAVTNYKVEAIFRIGWRSDLHPGMSIMFRGKEYGITRIDDFKGNKEDLVIYVYAIN
ncbi:phage head completion protein [Bacillus thuringiensis]|uniref:phage head completion protein n=1 Tax=Bacillus thuringiensis TaxID=1428 RepID=UPI0020D20180|nr:head-tail adaptor protein [Bacillus thuringiensis]